MRTKTLLGTLTLCLFSTLSVTMARAQTSVPGWSADPAMTLTVIVPVSVTSGGTVSIAAVLSDSDTRKNQSVPNDNPEIQFSVPAGIFSFEPTISTWFPGPGQAAISFLGTAGEGSEDGDDYTVTFTGIDLEDSSSVLYDFPITDSRTIAIYSS